MILEEPTPTGFPGSRSFARWMLVLEGNPDPQIDVARAWENCVHSLSRGGPVNPERESAEVLLGIGCVLSARADPVAAPMLAGAGELMRRLAVPMSAELRAAVDRAVRSAGGQPVPWWTPSRTGPWSSDSANLSMVPCDAHDVHLTQGHAWPGRRVGFTPPPGAVGEPAPVDSTEASGRSLRSRRSRMPAVRRPPPPLIR